MTGNPLDRIPTFDRLSIPAVLVEEGEDPAPALAEAGIIDAIVVPVSVGEDEPGVTFGDGLTPNIPAVLEFADQGWMGQDDGDVAPPEAETSPTSGTITTTAAAAFGFQSLAPVRRRTG